MTWQWSTLNHWGSYVNPTGLIVERKIGSADFETLTYSIQGNVPLSNENYSYEDTLTENDAAGVFALGYQLIYRVRAYWITP